MKKLWIVLVLAAPAIPALPQSEKNIETKITQVTVFLNKAQVTREGKVNLPAGKTDLVLTGLTSQLDQASIQIAGNGNFTILGIAHRQNFLDEHNMPALLGTLKDSLEYLQRQIGYENSQKEILNREEQMLLNNQKIGGANQNLPVAELKAMADFFRTRLGDIVNSRMKVDIRIRKLNERLNKVQRQINEQNNVYTRNTSEIVVSVSAEAATAAGLSVDYIVANAGWYALYDLRARNIKSPVQLNYKANVFQSTGEEWKNIKLRLSTANPTLGGVKPELHAWYLDFYQPYRALNTSGPERKSAVRGEAVPSERVLDQAAVMAEAESISDYFSTIHTTLNTEFDIALPYTVSSTNKPTLVDIRKHDLNANYIYSAVPKLDADAFLLARIMGWEEFSLLPGEANVFFEGTFVGKTYLDPNSIKDTLLVSMGRDKRIVVKREKLKDFSSRKLIGANQTETLAFEISARNTKNEPFRIILEDQIPVSKNSQIEVTVVDVGNAKFNKDTGKLSWELDIQPNETKKMIYRFEVKYPKDKVVAGLD